MDARVGLQTVEWIVGNLNSNKIERLGPLPFDETEDVAGPEERNAVVLFAVNSFVVDQQCWCLCSKVAVEVVVDPARRFPIARSALALVVAG